MAKSAEYPRGVRVRGEAVQINIPVAGKRRYVTIPQPPTPKGISEAGKLRAHLMQLKKWGTLTQADIDAACKVDTGIVPDTDDRPLFADYAQLYLDSLGTDDKGTRRKYKSALSKHWMPHLAAIPIADINPATIRKAISLLDVDSPKTFNDILTPLRGVFNLAFDDEIIDDLPTKRIKNKKIQAEDPDPFLPHERKQIISWMTEHWTGKKEIWQLYFVWQFWTGCRPGESLALDWSDIDLSNRLASITKTLSAGEVKQSTKTHESRNIHINDKALDVLIRLRDLTGHQDRVFISLHTGDPWTRPDKMGEKFQQMLKEAGIRQRPAYNCRHTYATTLLNSLIDVSAAAYQMGHDIQTFKTIYAKWINTEKMAIEMQKIEYD